MKKLTVLITAMSVLLTLSSCSDAGSSGGDLYEYEDEVSTSANETPSIASNPVPSGTPTSTATVPSQTQAPTSSSSESTSSNSEQSSTATATTQNPLIIEFTTVNNKQFELSNVINHQDSATLINFMINSSPLVSVQITNIGTINALQPIGSRRIYGSVTCPNHKLTVKTNNVYSRCYLRLQRNTTGTNTYSGAIVLE